MANKFTERIVNIDFIDIPHIIMVIENIYQQEDIGPNEKLYLYYFNSNNRDRIMYRSSKSKNTEFKFLREITRANCAQPPKVIEHLARSIIKEIEA